MVSYGMAFGTLISTAALALHLDDPAYVIVDCRAKLDDLDWGTREHLSAHIPGAVHADLTRDLSGPKTGTNGRHPLPDPAVLAQTFGLRAPSARDAMEPIEGKRGRWSPPVAPR